MARSTFAAQQTELGRVKVQLADALRDLDRKKSLVDMKYISPAELDRVRTLFDATREQQKAVEAQIQVAAPQVDSAQATVKQRQALLQQAEVDLGRTVIRAPVDGTVILRNIDAGQTVVYPPKPCPPRCARATHRCSTWWARPRGDSTGWSERCLPSSGAKRVPETK